jgi:hypothetical protein
MAKGHENLIPFSERTKEEARELGTKGGKKSGEARAKRKLFKVVLDELLVRGITSEEDLAMAEDFDLKGEVTQEQLVMCGLLKRAKQGDVAACRLILEITRDDEKLKIEKSRLGIDKEKLKMLKDKDGGEELDKLDGILDKLTGDGA